MADDSARKRGRRAGSPPLSAPGSDAEAALDEARRALAAERARTASLEAELDALRNNSHRRALPATALCCALRCAAGSASVRRPALRWLAPSRALALRRCRAC